MAAATPSATARLTAFLALGRFRVMVITPSATSTNTTSSDMLDLLGRDGRFRPHRGAGRVLKRASLYNLVRCDTIPLVRNGKPGVTISRLLPERLRGPVAAAGA